MFILGIAGGVASGKSFVAQELEKLGAVILNADHEGHEVLHDPAVIAAFRARWGESVIDESGQVIRAAVAERVFGSGDGIASERTFLNSVTHPRIRARLEAKLAEEMQRHTKLVVLDAALLFETGWNQLCQGVLFIDVPREQRLARALARGWQEASFLAREAAQLPVEEKRQRSHWTLVNAGPPAQTVELLRTWFQTTLAEKKA